MKEIKETGYFDPDININYFIIFPNSIYLKIWEYFLLLIVLYTMIVIPMEIGLFLRQKLSLSGGLDLYVICEIFIGLCFLFDLFLNFRKAIKNEQGDLITEPKQISYLYIRGFFFVDLLSSIPLDFIFNNNQSIEIQYALLKIPRFFRTIKLFFFISKFKRDVYLNILRLLFIYFMIIHYFGCLISYTESK